MPANGISLETIREAHEILEAHDAANRERYYDIYDVVDNAPAPPVAGVMPDRGIGRLSDSYDGSITGRFKSPDCFFCGSEAQGVLCELSAKMDNAKMNICPDCFWGAMSTVMQNARSK